MKMILISIAVIFCSVTSCSYPDNSNEDNTTPSETRKNISSRDLSINSSNSYSDLFLDSMTMENFISQKKVPDSIANRMRSFYNTRNYQFAWFDSDGLTEQARGFWNLHDYVTTYDKDTSLKDKTLKRQMDKLTTEDSVTVNKNDKKITNTELTLTEHFIKYISHYYARGFVKRKEMERFIPEKKQDPLKLADSIINKKHKDDKYFENVNPSYKALKEQLSKYYAIAKNGGWPEIHSIKKSLKKKMSSSQIPAIKKRLEITGDLSGNDSSKIFDDSLEAAIKNFQQRHGYNPTGVIHDSLIREMNVPVTKRIEQILMNMDRMRWMASDSGNNLIVVNIPEFE